MNMLKKNSVVLVVVCLLLGGSQFSHIMAQVVETDLAKGLDNLSLDQFFEESFRRLTLQDPELMTELGVSKLLGVGNDTLTDISDEYIRETQKLEQSILNILKSYDRSALTPQQQLSVDVYAWYLENLVQGHEFMYNDYPLNPVIIGVQNRLERFFTDMHPVETLQDAQDYVVRLAQVGTKFEQLIDGLERRKQAGVILPKFLLDWLIGELQQFAAAQAQDIAFYATFAPKVQRLQGVSDADKQALLVAAEQEIQTTVIPAYQTLVTYLRELTKAATYDAGVWKFPNGKEYYAHVLRYFTTTNLSADDIHEMGLQDVARIQAEMRAIFDRLGYPKNADLLSLFGRVVADSGVAVGEEIKTGYEQLIANAPQIFASAFDLQPKAGVIIRPDPIGGYYMPPAVDGSRPGIFFAQVSGTKEKFGMPSLLYHETIPGHHFQIALAQEADLPTFRRHIDFTAYTEGWALYAEKLMAELGTYKDDPYGDLGRLQMEIFRAARLVVDTGIHAKKWDYNQAVKYMVENTGLPPGMVQYEVSRYISWPGQAVAYKIGMIKIVELRQRAQDQLGDKFDLKEFHNVILNNGAMPLEILERVVDDYIARKS